MADRFEYKVFESSAAVEDLNEYLAALTLEGWEVLGYGVYGPLPTRSVLMKRAKTKPRLDTITPRC